VVFKENIVRLGFSLDKQKQKERKTEGLEEIKGFRRKSKRKRKSLRLRIKKR
jgi:hypothetical protein